ncbi:hypothetical protein ACCO45_003832 [Purpureocillium lilacinum]|uniref:Uncharacterized protein n=1 Tax=Purpureocillium lilacinum TaxID=33203 RepID=A0ACC4E3I2_PURLI
MPAYMSTFPPGAVRRLISDAVLLAASLCFGPKPPLRLRMCTFRFEAEAEPMTPPAFVTPDPAPS